MTEIHVSMNNVHIALRNDEKKRYALYFFCVGRGSTSEACALQQPNLSLKHDRPLNHVFLLTHRGGLDTSFFNTDIQ